MMKTANYIYWPAQLGHRELSMTQRYAHLSPDHMRAVADLTLRRPKPGLVRRVARRSPGVTTTPEMGGVSFTMARAGLAPPYS